MISLIQGCVPFPLSPCMLFVQYCAVGLCVFGAVCLSILSSPVTSLSLDHYLCSSKAVYRYSMLRQNCDEESDHPSSVGPGPRQLTAAGRTDEVGVVVPYYCMTVAVV